MFNFETRHREDTHLLQFINNELCINDQKSSKSENRHKESHY